MNLGGGGGGGRCPRLVRGCHRDVGTNNRSDHVRWAVRAAGAVGMGGQAKPFAYSLYSARSTDGPMA